MYKTPFADFADWLSFERFVGIIVIAKANHNPVYYHIML
eukprot:COSAG01_NODE_58351_length_306_cov_1.483092_1_plen_38_part_10